jgi:hypothetical protein
MPTTARSVTPLKPGDRVVVVVAPPGYAVGRTIATLCNRLSAQWVVDRSASGTVHLVCGRSVAA